MWRLVTETAAHKEDSMIINVQSCSSQSLHDMLFYEINDFYEFLKFKSGITWSLLFIVVFN